MVLKGNGIKGVLAGVLGGYSRGTRGYSRGTQTRTHGGLLQVVLKGSGIKESDGSEREPMKYKRDCNCEAECCPQCRWGTTGPCRSNDPSFGRLFPFVSSPPPQWSLDLVPVSTPPCSVVLKLDVRCDEKEYRWRCVVVATLRAVRCNATIRLLQRCKSCGVVATLDVRLFVRLFVCFTQRDVEGSHLGGPVRAPTCARVAGYSRVLTGTHGTQPSTHRYVKPADSDAEMPILLCKLRKVPALHIA